MAQNTESDYRVLFSFIASTRSVLNPKNRDWKSFGHAIVFAHFPTDWNFHRGQPANDSRFIQHNLDSIKYPVLPNEIPELEDKLKLRINLFSFDNAFNYKRYSLYISKRYYNEKINLLFWDGRYAWINNFSILLFDITKYVVSCPNIKIYQRISLQATWTKTFLFKVSKTFRRATDTPTTPMVL